MNKKIYSIMAVVLVAALGLFLYNNFLAPKGSEGAKSVTVVVLVEKESIDSEERFNTDAEFLLDLLIEQADALDATTLDTSFGPMVTGMKGYEADASSEYFHITINGEDAMTGVKEIPLNDGDTYVFEVKGF